MQIFPVGEGLSSGRMTSGATICEVHNERKQNLQGQHIHFAVQRLRASS